MFGKPMASSIPAVEPTPSGASYNPSDTAHQALLRSALPAEEFKIEMEKKWDSSTRVRLSGAEKDALVASLSEGHAIEDIEGMNLAVNDSHKMDQEADPKDQHYQQAAAEDAQNQVPAAENRRLTVVEPLSFGEKIVYHRNGTVSIQTADGELIPESDAYD